MLTTFNHESRVAGLYTFQRLVSSTSGSGFPPNLERIFFPLIKPYRSEAEIFSHLLLHVPAKTEMRWRAKPSDEQAKEHSADAAGQADGDSGPSAVASTRFIATKGYCRAGEIFTSTK